LNREIFKHQRCSKTTTGAKRNRGILKLSIAKRNRDVPKHFWSKKERTQMFQNFLGAKRNTLRRF